MILIKLVQFNNSCELNDLTKNNSKEDCEFNWIYMRNNFFIWDFFIFLSNNEIMHFQI